MVELKPCPFCGGAIRIIESDSRIDCTRTVVKCTTCGMLFSHSQDFVYSSGAKVALNESFGDIWIRRAGDTGDKERTE